MKVYVVTTGTYSDYHIITATIDKSVAEAVAKKFDDEYSHTYIEEYENAEVLLKPCWFVLFEKDGSVRSIKNASSSCYSYENINQCEMTNATGDVYVHVSADTAEAAIKIAAERRAEFLAEKEGIV